MKYLSLDLEATGLDPHDLIIEIAYVPMDAEKQEIKEGLSERHLISCPSFEELKPNLSDWVIEHNKTLIDQAHSKGITIEKFKEVFSQYLQSPAVKEFFGDGRIILFGKSMNAIDLPFMTRDFGHQFMRNFFTHRICDLSSTVYTLIDAGLLPLECESGSVLMNYLNLGDVQHTALEDAVNTAKMYFQLLNQMRGTF